MFMKKFLILDTDLSKKKLYFFALFCFIIIALYNLSSEYVMSSDSQRFSRWADNLIELNFSLNSFYNIEKASHRPHLFFFSVPVILIALCKFFFVSEWQSAFVLFNLFFLLLSIIFFLKSLLIIGIRPIFIVLTLPLIVISVDMLVWPRYILSDISYVFLVMLATYFVIKGICKNKILYSKLFLIIFLLLASRPTSIPIVFAILFFVLILKYQIFLSHKNILLFILIVFLFMPLLMSLAYLYLDNNFNEFTQIKFLINMVKMGMIIHDRPETWVDIPDGFMDIVYLYFLRIINFFNPYAETFSILHIILNVLQTFLILASLFIWSIFRCKMRHYNQIFFFVIILSLFVSAFHSFTLIDYDWRYRFPIILPLIILFSISLEILYKKFNK